MYSMDDIVIYNDPVSAVGVNSSLAYFDIDFGPIWSVISIVDCDVDMVLSSS